MKPQDELDFLTNFIQLSEKQAVKRDNLETFLLERSKVLVIDADSMLFNVVHAHSDKDFDLEEQYTDFNKQVSAVITRIGEDGFDVEDVIYCFTTCKNNFRKQLLPTYKANRDYNEMYRYVSMLKNYTIQALEEDLRDVRYSDILEADDLVGQAMRDIDNGIVVAIDKDLRQIKGAHFNYYKDKVKDEDGNVIIDRVETESGVLFLPRREFRGWSYTTAQEGYELLLKQLLVGDNSDNIKGANGIGAKRAEKLLDGKNNFGMLRAVYEAYAIYHVKHEGADSYETVTASKYKKHKGEKYIEYEKDRLKLNISLMKLW